MDISLNSVVLEDSQPLRCLTESSDVPFIYDLSIVKRIFIFEYNKHRARLRLDVDSSFRDIRAMLEVVRSFSAHSFLRSLLVCEVLTSLFSTMDR